MANIHRKEHTYYDLLRVNCLFFPFKSDTLIDEKEECINLTIMKF